jgi:hypothetical protein
MLPEVTVVVLHWNNVANTLRCLDSVLQTSYHCDVLVVDNGSGNNRIAQFAGINVNVELLEVKTNLGYAGGNNLGIRQAFAQGADYILILNNDAEIAPKAITELINAAQQYPQAGLLGPKIYERKDPDHLQSAGILLDRFYGTHHRGAGEIDVGQWDSVAEVDAISGCAMLISRHVVEQVGLLDERYFLYYEDIDWCLRARRAGFKVLYVPQAHVWHQSSNDGQRLARVTYYMNRNKYLLLSKQGASPSTIVLTTIRNVIWLLNWTFNPKWRGNQIKRNALFRALVDSALGNYGRQAYCYESGDPN